MIKVDNVKKEYGNFCLDCSFRVKPGSITGFIGKNGSGKTTAFKSILGLLKPDSGEILIFNKKHDELSQEERQKIAAVFSDSGFHNELSPNDLVPILKNLYPDFDKDYYNWEMKRQKLPYNNPIKEFSTGMKAKLKILIALSLSPKLLILDEPTLGLDAPTRAEVCDMLENFMDEDKNRSILISSHNSNDIETICDDLFLIDKGKILLHEDTDRILSDYGLIKLTSEQFNKLEKSYILRYEKRSYGYCCLTDQKQFYYENYPGIVIEPSTIDEFITLMTNGESF